MADSKYQQLMNDMRGDATQSDAVVQAQQASLSDQAARGMFNARDDIRHKLVEEGWYGQQTTGNVDLPENTLDKTDDTGNIWGSGEGTEWNEGGSIWSNEENSGVWGHENVPKNSSGSIEAPESQSAVINSSEDQEPEIEH